MLNPSDEIKGRLDIVEIIRQYMPLRASGSNFTGRCPFHNEKTPSFSVSPTKQVWHCFGCGRGGDLFSFIMEIEKLSFPEALRLLAPRAGVILKKDSGPEASERNRVLDILEQATRYYHLMLTHEPGGSIAREYLTTRGLKLETIQEWKLGFAPESWDDIINFLKNRKFSDTDIVSAGLAIKKPETGRCYNRFRGRIMFPLREVNGNVVGFTARILPGADKAEQQGKYINSPQTLVYDKSRLVFGLDKAKQAIRDENLAILVEGQMDCITAHEAGFKNVIATSGTALTSDQIGLIQRFTNRIAFAYDMDSAGRQALERSSELTLAAEMETLVITLPDYKDPDECIRRDPEAWKSAVQKAEPLMKHYVNEALEPLDMSEVSDRRAAFKKLLPRLAQLANTVERDYWIKHVSHRLGLDERIVRENVQPLIQTSASSSSVPSTVDQFSVSRPEILSEHILALLLRFPVLLEIVSQRLSIDQLIGASHQSLYRLLVIYYNKAKASGAFLAEKAEDVFHYNDLRNWLQASNQIAAGDIQTFDRLALLVEKNFSELSFVEAQAIIRTATTELRRSYLTNRLKVVTRLLTELESRSDRSSEEEDRLLNLLKEFKGLAEEIRQLSV